MGRSKEAPTFIDKSALPDDVREYIETLEEVILAKDDDDNTDDADDAEDLDDEGEDEDDGTDEDEEDHEDAPKGRRDVKVGKGSAPVRKASPDNSQGGKVSKQFTAILAKADPEVRGLITKMQGDIAKAEAIAKHERDVRETQEWIAKAATLTHVNDNPQQLGGLLKALHDKAPDEAEAVEKLLRAANNQVAKTGLWDEIGRTGGEFTGSTTEGKVAELRKSDPNLTREQAEARVFTENPDLYDEYLTGG